LNRSGKVLEKVVDERYEESEERGEKWLKKHAGTLKTISTSMR